MLNIQLTDGRKFQLETISPVALKNEGTYGNGSIDWEDEGRYLYDIATEIGIENALAALVNDQLTPLNVFVKKDCTLEYVMADSENGKAMIERTALFLLAYGIKSLNREVKRVKSAITNNTIYYDFDLDSALFTDEELHQAELAIAEAIQSNHSISGRKFPYFTAKKELLNTGETYILEYIDAHDDYGPIAMQTMNGFADLDQGFLLGDLSIIKNITLTQASEGNLCRVFANVTI